MKRKSFIHFMITLLVMFLFISPVLAQEFTLDDNPDRPLTGPGIPGLFSAEDPYGLWLPPVPAGLIGPSPSLGHPNGPFMDSDILWIGVVQILPLSNFGLSFVDSISVDHSGPTNQAVIGISFSIDRATGGVAGTWSEREARNNQQPADIYDSDRLYTHPSTYAGQINPQVLPTAGNGGSNALRYDDSHFGLIAPTSPIQPGTHDNIVSFNQQGGLSYQNNTFFTVSPAETALTGLNSSDIGAIAPRGMPALYAMASTLGLHPTLDSVDALIVWDYGTPLLNEPGIDYALFSVSPGSQILNNWVGPQGQTIDAGAILFTDFTGTFSVYLFSPDLGLAPAPGMPAGVENVDALDMYQ